MTRILLTALVVSILIGLSVAGGTALGRVINPGNTTTVNRLAVVPPGSFPMSYQGYLTHADGSRVPDGTHEVVFSIYESEATTTVAWQESQSLTTKSGRFSAYLGLLNPINPSIFADNSRVQEEIKFLLPGDQSQFTFIPLSRFVSLPTGDHTLKVQWLATGDGQTITSANRMMNVAVDSVP